MKKEIELLAPGGDVDSVKAAIAAGANAIYCGLDRFNARNRATNISFDDLQGILRLAHKNNVQVFLTLNIIIIENEIPSIISLLKKLVNISIDGIIIQDLGLFYLISKYFNSLKIHASTQLTTHNEGQIKFLSELKTTRVNLSRELNIREIKSLAEVGHKNQIETEVFVHGSYCISFSGICYMSSVHGGNSGNRGRCSQPCRDQYETTAAGKDFPLNLKDNSAYFDLEKLVDARVFSLKIEGRIKKFDYVYSVVNTWRKQIRNFYDHHKINTDFGELYKVFNRDFSNSFLKGDIHKDMFIDNPRDFSVQHLTDKSDFKSEEELEIGSLKFYDEKERVKIDIENKINKFSIAKEPLIIDVLGRVGEPLKVNVKTTDNSFDISSTVNLSDRGTEPLNREMIYRRLKALDESEYFIRELNLNNIKGELYLPFRELTSIKKKIMFVLNGSKELVEPVDVPLLKNHVDIKHKPSLSVLISSHQDLNLCEETSADIYFQLPNGLKDKLSELIDLFIENKYLTPLFPSVLIGEDYKAAQQFLEIIKPSVIVTNNTGVAYDAFERDIPWIAGPYLNIVNSYSLQCLKEYFNCSGAFISNEISKDQIRQLKKPENFKLYYSVYHPIVLMTSRQCLFHQVTGCEKHKIDSTCISQCEKSTSITSLKKKTSFIDKSKGNYNSIYNETNYLNTDIVKDLQDTFTGFLVDLRNVKTETKVAKDNSSIVHLFENLLKGKDGADSILEQNINPTSNSQYRKGI